MINEKNDYDKEMSLLNGKRKVTIYDIAEEAGVSPSMVSRVYNGYGGVNAGKKEEIRRLLKKYNYVPDALAKGLRKTQTRTLGVIASDLRNPFFSHLLVECEEIAGLNNYMIFSCDSLEKVEMELSHFKRLDNQKVDAIIHLGGSSDKKDNNEKYLECIKNIAKRIPIVTTGYSFYDNVYSVKTNEARGMQTMLEYILSMGHREIAFVGGTEEIHSTWEKREQYRKTLEKRNIPLRREYVIDGGYDKESGYAGMQTLLNSGAKPSAVIMINEMAAVGAMKALREKKIRVPEDISLACFDNTFISESIRPALTAVGCDYKKFARKLVYTALDALGKHRPEQVAYVESVFVIRESVTEVG